MQIGRSPVVIDGIAYLAVASGHIVRFSPEDIPVIEGHLWALMGRGYPSFTDYSSGCPKTIKMHTLIIGLGADHINGDKLDNRRENLRHATNAQNNANRKKSEGTSSKYKGVRWDKSRSKWMAALEHNHKSRTLGRFDNEEVAARCYDLAASEVFGEFAKLNFPKMEKIE